MRPALIRDVFVVLFAMYAVFLALLYGYEKSYQSKISMDILTAYHCGKEHSEDSSCLPFDIEESAVFDELPVNYPSFGFFSEDIEEPNKMSFVAKASGGVIVYKIPKRTMERQNTFVLGFSLIAAFLILAGAFVFYVFYERLRLVNYSLEKHNTRLNSIALTDSLTGCWNRRHLKHNIISYIEKSVTFKQDVFVGIVDIDHFKSVNDRFGHDVGDVVLQGVSRDINALLPRSNSPGLYRLGGEEFLFIIHGIDERDLFYLVKSFYDHFEKRVFEQTGESVGLSMGLTRVRHSMDSESEILKRADSALYEAKQSGRNKVVFKEIISHERK